MILKWMICETIIRVPAAASFHSCASVGSAQGDASNSQQQTDRTGVAGFATDSRYDHVMSNHVMVQGFLIFLFTQVSEKMGDRRHHGFQH